MSLKHAVLALIVERRGYGYELVQRFEERVGPGWRLNPSAVYPALDQLERGGLVTSAARHGGTHRSPRIVYAATTAGEAALETWLRATDAPPEPVRADLHLRLAFSRHEHRVGLAQQLAADERTCATLLARYPRPRSGASAGTRSAVGPALVDDAVVTRLRAELAWLAHARAAIERDAG
jgi:DNA-binding PadR family transcriptional regulator